MAFLSFINNVVFFAFLISTVDCFSIEETLISTRALLQSYITQVKSSRTGIQILYKFKKTTHPYGAQATPPWLTRSAPFRPQATALGVLGEIKTHSDAALYTNGGQSILNWNLKLKEGQVHEHERLWKETTLIMKDGGRHYLWKTDLPKKNDINCGQKGH